MPMGTDLPPEEPQGKFHFLNRRHQLCDDTSPFGEPSVASGVIACNASDSGYGGSKQLEAALDLAMMQLEFTLFAMQNPAWLHISKEFLIEWYLVTCRAQGIQPCTRSVQEVLGPVRPPPPGSSPAPPPPPPPMRPASPKAAASPAPLSIITTSPTDKTSTCRRSLSRIPTLARSFPATPTAVTPKAVATNGPRNPASSYPSAPSPIIIPSPCPSPSPSPSCTPCSAWSTCSSSRSSASSGAATPQALRQAALDGTLHTTGAEDEQAETETNTPRLLKPWESAVPDYSCGSPAPGRPELQSPGGQRPATITTRCSLQWPSPSRFGSQASRIPVPPDMAMAAAAAAPPTATRLPSFPSKPSSATTTTRSVNILVLDESIITSSTCTSPTATHAPETPAPPLAYTRCTSLPHSSSSHTPANPTTPKRGSSIPRSPTASPTAAAAIRFRTSPVTRSTSSLPSLHRTNGPPYLSATTDAATATPAAASASVTAISLPRSRRLSVPDALATALAAAEEALLLAPLAEACEGWEKAARQDAEMADLGGLGLAVGVC